MAHIYEQSGSKGHSESAPGNAGQPEVDCLVVGAGPAGLVVATYLSRFHRHVLVADGGKAAQA